MKVVSLKFAARNLEQRLGFPFGLRTEWLCWRSWCWTICSFSAKQSRFCRHSMITHELQNVGGLRTRRVREANCRCAWARILWVPTNAIKRSGEGFGNIVKQLKVGRYLQQALVCYIRESLFILLRMNLNPIKGFARSVDRVERGNISELAPADYKQKSNDFRFASTTHLAMQV